ncbi:hypothetical protein ALC60_08230 [Trachymyrmex zeteki]|uniref:Uncharacterized protein n=1 Tax=Mycetomoellerius zeteki TaxID=64791 RepID=A0A151WXJ0_9HYME|nr:hypothetical protein ALC60_08230 [Trachymyrmex zeteki]
MAASCMRCNSHTEPQWPSKGGERGGAASVKRSSKAVRSLCTLCVQGTPVFQSRDKDEARKGGLHKTRCEGGRGERRRKKRGRRCARKKLESRKSSPSENDLPFAPREDMRGRREKKERGTRARHALACARIPRGASEFACVRVRRVSGRRPQRSQLGTLNRSSNFLTSCGSPLLREAEERRERERERKRLQSEPRVEPSSLRDACMHACRHGGRMHACMHVRHVIPKRARDTGEE